VGWPNRFVSYFLLANFFINFSRELYGLPPLRMETTRKTAHARGKSMEKLANEEQDKKSISPAHQPYVRLACCPEMPILKLTDYTVNPAFQFNSFEIY